MHHPVVTRTPFAVSSGPVSARFASYDGRPMRQVEGRVGKAQVQRTAAVGVAEHGNSAVLVTVAPGGELLDRRRGDLTHRLPTHPYHHEGSWAVGRYANSPWARPISLAEAVALVERVHESAARGACQSLAALAAAVAWPISRLSVCASPTLPATIDERNRDK